MILLDPFTHLYLTLGHQVNGKALSKLIVEPALPLDKNF